MSIFFLSFDSSFITKFVNMLDSFVYLNVSKKRYPQINLKNAVRECLKKK